MRTINSIIQPQLVLLLGISSALMCTTSLRAESESIQCVEDRDCAERYADGRGSCIHGYCVDGPRCMLPDDCLDDEVCRIFSGAESYCATLPTPCSGAGECAEGEECLQDALWDCIGDDAQICESLSPNVCASDTTQGCVSQPMNTPLSLLSALILFRLRALPKRKLTREQK